MPYYDFEHYTYKNGILKNKFNIKDQKTLDIQEAKIVTAKLSQLAYSPIKGDFNLLHLQKIHYFIFNPIYKWAGKIRTCNLIKDDTFFTTPSRIIPELNKLFLEIKKENYLIGLNKSEFVKRLAYFLGEINVHHPFREGNGRTQRTFIKFLAESAGYEISFSNISQKDMINASIQAYKEQKYNLMEDLIVKSISEINSHKNKNHLKI